MTRSTQSAMVCVEEKIKYCRIMKVFSNLYVFVFFIQLFVKLVSESPFSALHCLSKGYIYLYIIRYITFF